MGNLMVHIGLGDYVSAAHTIAIIQPGSVTGRRRLNAARRINQYLDCSHGKGIRSYILFDDNSVVSSHLSPRTLANRYSDEIGQTGDSDSQNASAIKKQCSFVSGRKTYDPEDEVDDDDLPFTEIPSDDDDFDGDIEGDIDDEMMEDEEDDEGDFD